jgi:ribosome-associated toxin RatA of RatAB toxin-antitoxin module
MVLFMTTHPSPNSRRLSVVSALCGLLLCAAAQAGIAAEPSPAAAAAFNSYVAAVELRLARQHRSQDGFLPLPGSTSQSELRLRRGDPIIEKLTPSAGAESPGALLHHWRGTAFAAGARAADFERVMRDFNSYPQYFSPQVVQARVMAQQGDQVQAVMRVRQQRVITVVMDATYDTAFSRLDARHGFSLSRSTRMSEIDAAGTAEERALDAEQEHGFLWRLNTYWSYEERDGGLDLQIESVSLTRSIPRGLGWVVGPFVESVPRESLEFTLRSACKALRK